MLYRDKIGVELAQVFMLKLVHLEFDQDVAFEDPMVEDPCLLNVLQLAAVKACTSWHRRHRLRP